MKDRDLDGSIPTRKLGRGPLEVPIVGFGAAHLGELYRKLADHDATAALEHAWDRGIRYFDTAPLYGHGLSERRVGSVLRHKPRRDFFLSTKVGISFSRPKDVESFDASPWVGALPFEATFDYTYDGILRSYEQSLLRLGINSVDALLIHNLDRGYHDAQTYQQHWRDLRDSGFRALDELRAIGEIKVIGAGINVAEAIGPFVQAFPLDLVLVAMPYTLLDQFALDHGMNECMDRKVSVVIGSPFASGILAGDSADGPYNYGSANAEVRDKVRRLRSVCAGFAVPLAAAALQFPLAHPAVCSVIPGMTSAREVDINLDMIRQDIPPGLWQSLREHGLIGSDVPTPDRPR